MHYLASTIKTITELKNLPSNGQCLTRRLPILGISRQNISRLPSINATLDLSAEQLQFVRLVRQTGPFEDWLATYDDAKKSALRFLARRPAKNAEPLVNLSNQIRTSSKLARIVAHYQVVHCHGILELSDGRPILLQEYFEGYSLKDLEEYPIQWSANTVLWIARQILNVTVHTHSLGIQHGNLTSEAIWLTLNGELRIDFGLSTEEQPKDDISSIKSIILSLLSQATSTKQTINSLENTIQNIFQNTLEETQNRDLENLEHVLAEVFYCDLDGNDDDDGRNAIKHQLQRQFPKHPKPTNTTEDLVVELQTNTTIDKAKQKLTTTNKFSPSQTQEQTADGSLSVQDLQEWGLLKTPPMTS